MSYDSVLKNGQNRLNFINQAGKNNFEAWEDARSDIHKGITDIEKEVIKGDVIKAKFQTLGETFSRGGVKKEAQEKIYHQWAKIYQENQKKVKPLKEKLATLTSKGQILSVNNLSEDIKGVIESQGSKKKEFSSPEKEWLRQLTDKVKPMMELKDELGDVKASFEILDSVVQTQETIFEKVHLALEHIKVIEEDIKQTSLSRSQKIAYKQLKAQKKSLESIKKDLLNPEKIMKLIYANKFEKVQSDLASIEKDIPILQIRITPENILKEAFEIAFRNTPFQTPNRLDDIQRLFDLLSQFDSKNEKVFKVLKSRTSDLYDICAEVTKALEKCYEKNAKGDIDLERPKLNKSEIATILEPLYNKTFNLIETIFILKDKINKIESNLKSSQKSEAIKQCLSEILVNLDRITEPLAPKILEKAFETTFQNVPFKMPDELEDITTILDTQMELNPENHSVYSYLKDQCSALHGICSDATTALGDCYVNDAGNIDLKQPKLKRSEISKIVNLYDDIFRKLQNTIKQYLSNLKINNMSETISQGFNELLATLDKAMKPFESIRTEISNYPPPPKGVKPPPPPPRNVEASNVTQPIGKDFNVSSIQTIPDAMKKLEAALKTTFQEIPFKDPEGYQVIMDILERLRKIDRPNEALYSGLKAQVTNLFTICVSKEAKEFNKYEFSEKKINFIKIQENKEDLDRILDALFYGFGKIKGILNDYRTDISKTAQPPATVKITISNIESLINTALQNLRIIDNTLKLEISPENL